MPHREVHFEGFTEEQILGLPSEMVEGLILLGEPLVFRAGSAIILGAFKICSDRLVIELAQIEGGGEGVLLSLGSLARRYANLHHLKSIEWIVHAVHCAEPNLKLRQILERRGFKVEKIAGIGESYHLIDNRTA